MIFGLEFPPISHVVEWPTLFGSGAFSVNKVIILMWVSAALAFAVMFIGGRKRALVPTGMQNVAESALDFVEEGIVLQTIGEDGLKFTPFLLTLFTFVLTCNIWGLIPGVQMPVNARIALPMFLALTVYVIYHAVGVIKTVAFKATFHSARSGAGSRTSPSRNGCKGFRRHGCTDNVVRASCMLVDSRTLPPESRPDVDAACA